MTRWAIVLAATLAMLGVPACGDTVDSTEANPAGSSDPTRASTDGSDGRIVFERYDPSIDAPVTYTVNPDGSDMRPLFEDGHSESARWSPDGTEILILCCDDGMAAHLIDPRTDEMPNPSRSGPEA